MTTLPAVRANATANSYGQASITLEVSMQPGDNYRAAASCLQDAVDDQVDQVDADLLGVKVASGGLYVANGYFSGYKVPVVWSKMLTVWRKLHVELATMQRPGFVQNTWNGMWANPRTYTAPGGGEIPERVVIDISSQPVTDDQLEQGWIQLEGDGLDELPSFRIFSNNSLGVPADTITVVMPREGESGPIGVEYLQGVDSGSFTASDDDIRDGEYFHDSIPQPAWAYGSDLGGTTSPNLDYPDYAGTYVSIAQLFEPAYIVPVITATNATPVPFEQNFPGLLASSWFFAEYETIRTTPISISTYWTTLVGSGFQAEDSADADPNIEESTKGATPHALGSTVADPVGFDDQTGICVVFKETAFDMASWESIVIAHEIAHTLGLPHNSGGVMDEQPENGSTFGSPSLKRLRDYQEP